MKYTTISFPGLGLEMNPPRSFELFGLNIYLYGIVIAVGLVLPVTTYYAMWAVGVYVFVLAAYYVTKMM